MQSYKKDFPIFANNSGLIYLDSAASAQKPAQVINGIQDFLSHSYANIHRGSYSLSEQSEDLYYASKEKYASYVGFSGDEIIYTYNATYAYNLLAQTLRYSGVLKAGDVVLIDIAEHHANIVPWHMLSERHGIVVERVDLDQNFQYNIEDFKKKYTDRVKVVSLSGASNVTGVMYSLSEIAALLRPETFFIVDGSQVIPHTSINTCFEEASSEAGSSSHFTQRIDALIATGHKIMADTGIGMLALRKKHIKSLRPARGGGGMIDDVQRNGFTATSGRQKFEPGTPHIIGAVSLLRALEYIDSIGGYDAIMTHEKELISYALDRIAANKKLTLFGPSVRENRLGIFSLTVAGMPNHIRVGEQLAMEGICVRCGAHCTHPLFHSFEQQGSCRISTYLYNDIADLEKTFDALEKL